MNPLILKSLKEKYGENFEKDAQDQYDDRLNQSNTGALFANIGDAIAGKSIGSQNRYFEGVNERAKADTVGKIDADRKSMMENMQFDQGVAKNQRDADLSDPNSKASVTFRNSIKANYPDLAQVYGADWENISAADQESIFKPLQLKEQQRARVDAAKAMAGQRQDAREERQSIKDEARRVKLEERDLKLAVPGYERTGEVLPKDEEAMKFRKGTATANALGQKLQRMKELVKANGSFEWGGDGGTEMESLATEIQLLGKSPELYELGVLTGPDLSLLQKISADPSSLSSLFTRDGSRQKQLDSQITSLEQKLGATADSLGYRKAGETKDVAPQTKVVGGKTYKKVPGGWEEVQTVGSK